LKPNNHRKENENMKLRTVCVAVAAMMAAASAWATAYTWNAEKTSGEWTNSENWLVNGAATTGYPSTSSDTASFAADTKATITLNVATTIKTLILSTAGCDITLKPAENVAKANAKLTASGLTLTGSGSALTFDGLSASFPNKTTIGVGTTCNLDNGTEFSVSGYFYNNGTMNILGGSAVTCGCFYWAGLTVLDDSTVTVSSSLAVFAWNANGAEFKFRGTKPVVNITATTGECKTFFTGAAANYLASIEFSIPVGGYSEAPIQTPYSNRNAPNQYADTSKVTINIASDSPAKLSGETLENIPLISWKSGSRGLIKDAMLEGSLPQKTDKFVWDTVNTTPQTLGVSLSGSLLTAELSATGVALSGFEASESFRNVYIAWGAKDLGTTTTAWGNNYESVGTIAANETSFTYSFANKTAAMTSANVSWGDEAFKALRLVIDDGTMKRWSPAVEWHEAGAPVFDGVLDVEGTDGDRIQVSGKMASFEGDSCTLAVLTGASEDALTNEWSGEDLGAGSVIAASAASYDFSFTLCETNTAATRYIAPGSAWSVAVVATAANGMCTTSKVATVTTANTQPALSSVTGTAEHNVGTFTGNLTSLGLCEKVTVSLWYREQSAGGDYEADEGATLEVTSTGAFTLPTFAFPKVETTYAWKLRAEGLTPGGTATQAVEVAGAALALKDTAAYTWTGEGADGAWTNKANWKATTDVSYGYPNFSYSTISFAAGTTNEVVFDAARTIRAIVIDGADTVVKFTQGGAGTNETKMTVAEAPTFTGAGSQLVLDNVAVAFGDCRVDIGKGFTLKLTNGADALFTGTTVATSLYNNQGGRIVLEGESTFNVTLRSYMGTGLDGTCLEINDSRFVVERFFYYGTDAGNKVLFRGDHPELYVKSLCYGVEEKAALTFEFEVPVGGYEKAPIYTVKNGNPMGTYSSKIIMSGIAAYFSIAESSPACRASAALEGVPLVSWPTAGMHPSFAKEGTLLRLRDKFVWKDGEGNVMEAGSGYPVSLCVNISGAPHGFMMIVR
jgi:hypothetical protein